MRFLKSEAGALVLWLVASLTGAAILTPWLYDAGKAFAQSATTHDYPPVLESVARSAQRAQSERYFSRCMLLSGLALLPILIFYIKKLPNTSRSHFYSLKKTSLKVGVIQLVSGVILGAVSIWILALVLMAAGAVLNKECAFCWENMLSKAFFPALGVSVIEEMIFRGLLLGLFLRTCSVHRACLLGAIFFSFVHFLKPSGGAEIADPRAWYAGFEILMMTLAHFTDASFFFGDFTTLIVLGLMLGWSRVRTHALWLPIGLHLGLVMAIKCFSLYYALDCFSPLNPWLIGETMTSGILPMLILGICFLACVRITRRWQIEIR